MAFTTTDLVRCMVKRSVNTQLPPYDPTKIVRTRNQFKRNLNNNALIYAVLKARSPSNATRNVSLTPFIFHPYWGYATLQIPLEFRQMQIAKGFND